MIRSVTSDLPSFKSLTFRPGLNILLADKSDGASDRQSRNGAGKSSFVELVHFLFGANADKSSIFRSEYLAACSFTATADIGGSIVEITRSGEKPSRIRVNGDTGGWPLTPAADGSFLGRDVGTGSLVFSLDEWKTLLGTVFFGLKSEADIDGQQRFAPGFRSLFSFFARRQSGGGFLSPTRHTDKQQPWDAQVSLSYLLGLDTRIPREFQEVRAQEKAVTELRKAAKAGDLGRFFGSAADLRTKAAIAEARARRLRDQLASFTVVPEYTELEREASALTRQISALNDANTIDQDLVLQLEEALEDERAPAVANLDRLYREAGIVLPVVAVQEGPPAQVAPGGAPARRGDEGLAAGQRPFRPYLGPVAAAGRDVALFLRTRQA